MTYLPRFRKVLMPAMIALAALTARADETGVNSVSFRVEANSPVEQYASFWLLPAQYTDGTFTAYTVHVNGQYASKSTKRIGDQPYDTEKEFGKWNQWYGYGLIDAYKAIINTPRQNY